MFAFLRCPILLSLLAAVVLCGYAGRLVACDLPASAASYHHVDQTDACTAECACVCQEGYVYHSLATAPAPGVLVVAEAAIERGKFPPGAVPPGIDYPPQLA